MTKKHFEAIAKVAREVRADYNHAACQGALDALVDRLADVFKADNQNFDKARFLKACK